MIANKYAKLPTEMALDLLFANRPHSRRLFEQVQRFIESIGPVQIAVTKTQVSFGVKTKFAWVWLPQMWTKNRPDGSITLTFASNRCLVDARIASAVEPRPGRWTHHVVIEKQADLDRQVKAWVRQAYAYGTLERLFRRSS